MNQEFEDEGRQINKNGLERIDQYALISEVGQGAMGTVYKAHDEILERDVAIKLFPESVCHDKKYLDRFRREAKSAARLNHPNITQIYHTGTFNGRPYFVMEFVDGRDLNKLISEQGRIPFEKAVTIAIQVCQGLEYALGRNVIHRDIKPANILMNKDGLVKITDFGLAKLLDVSGLTLPGEAMGTPLYMSPEQIRGETCGHHTDIYSLGATLYHILAGRPPFEAESLIVLCTKHAKEFAVPLARVVPALPRGISDVVNKMMAKSADKRYDTYRQLIAELEKEKSLMAIQGIKAVSPCSDMNEETIYNELLTGLDKGKDKKRG